MTITRFEDRLLTELRAVVAERPAPTEVAPRHVPARRLALGGAVTAAAAIAAALIATGVGGSSTPAYAVDQQADGDVTVTINRLSDADGLERKLRAAGIPAVVRYAPDEQICAPQGDAGPDPGTPRGKVTTRISHQQGGATTFTISRDSVGPDQTLLVSTSGGEPGGPTGVGVAVVSGVSGVTATCTALPGPAPDAEGPSFRTGP